MGLGVPEVLILLAVIAMISAVVWLLVSPGCADRVALALRRAGEAEEPRGGGERT